MKWYLTVGSHGTFEKSFWLDHPGWCDHSWMNHWPGLLGAGLTRPRSWTPPWKSTLNMWTQKEGRIDTKSKIRAITRIRGKTCLYYLGPSVWHVFPPYQSSKLLVILQSPDQISPELHRLSHHTRIGLIAPTSGFRQHLKQYQMHSRCSIN